MDAANGGDFAAFVSEANHAKRLVADPHQKGWCDVKFSKFKMPVVRYEPRESREGPYHHLTPHDRMPCCRDLAATVPGERDIFRQDLIQALHIARTDRQQKTFDQALLFLGGWGEARTPLDQVLFGAVI